MLERLEVLTQDLLDGFLGAKLTLDEGRTNIFYGESPTIFFLLGKVMFWLALFTLMLRSLEKKKKSEENLWETVRRLSSNLFAHLKQQWLGKLLLLMTSFVFLAFLLYGVSEVWTSIKVYLFYSNQEMISIKEGELRNLAIQKGMSRSSFASIEGSLLFGNELIDVHFIDGNKRLANQILNSSQDSFEVVVYLDDQGQVIRVNAFME